jgi:hypothetical protein
VNFILHGCSPFSSLGGRACVCVGVGFHLQPLQMRHNQTPGTPKHMGKWM